jgi:hypothetical protein
MIFNATGVTPDDPLALTLAAVAGLLILAALAYTNWRMRH